MIIKHIPIRTMNRSNFSGLVKYITNAQDKNERVGEIRISNSAFEHPAWAAQEAEAVQRQNTRSKVDKTYHMLVSFRAGEQPSADILNVIEDKLCAALGYQEHQRISAVHHDTDHLHIHIAINKVHPTKLTVRHPYNDYKIFADLAVKLEREYGLDHDNHVAHKTPGEAKAQDMEHTSGIESLIGWIKRGCLPELLSANSWEALHNRLATHSLTLSERGNGLVITAKNGIAAKASSLDRNLSKHALEKRLGEFQPALAQEVKVTNRYEIKPMASPINTQQLWALYQHEQRERTQRRTVLQERAQQRRDRRIANAKKGAQVKRAVIQPTKGRLAKAVLHHSISDGLTQEIRTIQRDYQEDRRMVYAKGKHVVWYDWLKAKGWEGNVQGLEVLRHRYDHAQVRGNAIGSDGVNSAHYLTNAKIDTVTKRGTVHYQIAQTVLRDDGKLLRLSKQVSEDVVETALKMATQRFGRQLAITGTESFRSHAITAGAKLNINFTDPAMEQQRLALVVNNTARALSPEEAALRYINERNEKRRHGIDIMMHRRYAQSDAGKLPFAGLRQIEGQQLMLLQTPTEMLVLPLDHYAVKRAQRLSIGNMVEVNERGILRARGRKIPW